MSSRGWLATALVLMGTCPPAARAQPDIDGHGILLGLVGAEQWTVKREIPGARFEVGIQAGYRYRSGDLEHNVSVVAGLGLGVGDCAEHRPGVRIAYGLAWIRDRLVLGGELAVLGMPHDACIPNTGVGLWGTEETQELVSVAFLPGVELDPVQLGLSGRFGYASWDFCTSDPLPLSGGGYVFTVTLGVWARLLLGSF